MFERLPQGWSVVQIGQVAELINGYSQFNSKSYVDNGIPIFRIGDLGGLIDLASVKRVAREVIPSFNQKRLFRGDILIAKIGKRVGVSSVYNLDNPAILSSQVAGVRAKKINPTFLAAYIESSHFYGAIKPYFFGSTRDNISTSQIGLTPIPLPPLPTQRKIASILSNYDDLIENNTRRIKLLEEMAGTIYREWFVKFRFPGHENVKIVESELGRIPLGWALGKLGSVLENTKAHVKPGSHLEGLPYVPIDCIPRRSIALMEHKPYTEAKSSLIAFERNDILFGAMRSYFHKVVLAPFDGITRQTCFVLRSRNCDDYPFNLFTVFQDSTIAYCSNHSTGSTIPYTMWDGALAIMPIVKPPDQLTQLFSEVVSPMLELIRMLSMRNTILRRNRDLLLPKLISGELDVSEPDININATQSSTEDCDFADNTNVQ